MFTQNQIKQLLTTQDELNSSLDPNWKRNAWDFMLAASLECAEAIEHHGWKWWKKQEPDLPQVKMELIDILHFLLSQTLKTSCPITVEYTQSIRQGYGRLYILRDLLESTSSTDMYALSHSVKNLIQAFHTFGMSGEEVFKMYMGKNCLNSFRYANGYGDGTYIKVWADGKEDNEHLTGILNSLPADLPNFKEELLNALTTAYNINH